VGCVEFTIVHGYFKHLLASQAFKSYWDMQLMHLPRQYVKPFPSNVTNNLFIRNKSQNPQSKQKWREGRA